MIDYTTKNGDPFMTGEAMAVKTILSDLRDAYDALWNEMVKEDDAAIEKSIMRFNMAKSIAEIRSNFMDHVQAGLALATC